MNLKQKIKDLIRSKNFVRAAIIYGTSLAIGVAGYLTLGRVGMYILTCVPGLGSGIATAYLSNGHKKPVTIKNILASTAMIAIITLACWLIGIPIDAALFGAALGFVGSLVGHWFIHLENKRSNNDTQNSDSQDTSSENSETNYETNSEISEEP